MNIDGSEINYDKLPEGLRGCVRRYITERVTPGGFLQAVICNDLRESFGRADDINRACLFEIVCWFYNNAPGQCWGSPEKAKAWLNGKQEN